MTEEPLAEEPKAAEDAPVAAEEIEEGDDIEVDLSTGTINDKTRGKTYFLLLILLHRL